MLDIIIHQGNLNQSHNEMHFTLTRMVKIKEIVRIGDEAVEKSERPCAVTLEDSMELLKRLNTVL